MIFRQTCAQCRRSASMALCDACWRQVIFEPHIVQLSPHLTHYAYGPYQGVIKGLLYQVKYHQRRQLARALGFYLGQWLKTQALGFECLAPVPMHADKLKHRGYNQAEWIAKGLKDATKKPIRKVFERVENTPALYDLKPEERQKVLKDAFVYREPKRARPLCLVDDILTTGSTLKALEKSRNTGKNTGVHLVSCSLAYAL